MNAAHVGTQKGKTEFTRRGVLAAAAALAAAGCSPATAVGHAADGSPETTSLQIGSLKSVTAAGLYIAQSRGFFRTEGLDVTIVPTTGSGPVMADLLNGRLDVSFGNYVSFIEAQAKGVADLRILDEGNDAVAGQQGLIVLPHSPVRSAAGLPGKTIGVNALQNLAQLMLSSMLTAHGVPMSSVKLVPVPFPDMATALAAGRIDVAWIVEPYLADARLRYDTVTIADSNQGATAGLPISGYFCTASWASRHPKTAAAFVRALNRGQAIASTSHQAIEQVMATYTTVTPKAASLVVAGDFPAGVNRAQVQRIADLMHRFGMLSSPFSVAPMTG